MPDESVLLFLLVSSVWVGIIAGLCVCIDLRANILFTKDVVLEARDYLGLVHSTHLARATTASR